MNTFRNAIRSGFAARAVGVALAGLVAASSLVLVLVLVLVLASCESLDSLVQPVPPDVSSVGSSPA